MIIALRVLGAIASFVVVTLVMIVVAGLVGGIVTLGAADHMFPVLATDNSNTGYQERLLTLGPAISLGLIAASIAWDYKIGPKRELIFCAVLFVISGAISGFNFAVGDSLINPRAQFVIDLVLIVVSGALLFALFGWTPQRPFPRSARAGSIFLVMLCGILIPGYYAAMLILSLLGLAGSYVEADAFLKLVAAALSVATAVVSLRQKTA